MNTRVVQSDPPQTPWGVKVKVKVIQDNSNLQIACKTTPKKNIIFAAADFKMLRDAFFSFSFFYKADSNGAV